MFDMSSRLFDAEKKRKTAALQERLRQRRLHKRAEAEAKGWDEQRINESIASQERSDEAEVKLKVRLA